MPKRSNIDYMLIKERTGFTIKNCILEIRPRLGFVWNSLPQKVYAVSTERKLKSKFRWNFSVLQCHFPCDNNSFKYNKIMLRCHLFRHTGCQKNEAYQVIYFFHQVISHDRRATSNWHLPNSEENARYCILCRWIGISFAMSWWIMGIKGGQFLSSMTIPAVKRKEKDILLKDTPNL